MENGPPSPNPQFFLGLSHVYSLIARALLARIGMAERVAVEQPPESLALIEPVLESLKETRESRILELSSSRCRKDLDKTSRIAWGRVLERFYEDNGYAVEKGYLEPDHVAVQLAFVAYMMGDIAHSLSKSNYHEASEKIIVLHRFFSAHLMPTLSQCDDPVARRIGELARLTLSLLRPMAITAAKRKRST